MWSRFNRFCIMWTASMICASAATLQAHAGVTRADFNASCSNLKVGEEYEFRVELVDKESGDLIENGDGSFLAKSLKFIASKTHANVAVDFKVDNEKNSGKTLLIKAGIYHDGKISQELSDSTLPDGQLQIPGPEQNVFSEERENSGLDQNASSVEQSSMQSDLIEDKVQTDVTAMEVMGGLSSEADASAVKPLKSDNSKGNSNIAGQKPSRAEKPKKTGDSAAGSKSKIKKNRKSGDSHNTDTSTRADSAKNESTKTDRVRNESTKKASAKPNIKIAEYAPPQAYSAAGASGSSRHGSHSSSGKSEGGAKISENRSSGADSIGQDGAGANSGNAGTGGFSVTAGKPSNDTSGNLAVKATAFNLATGTNESKARSNVTLVDKLELKGLEPGKKYTIKSRVINSRTGKQLCASAHGSREFTAKRTGQTESVAVSFDATEWAGTLCCVVSDVYCNGSKIKSIASDSEARRVSIVGSKDNADASGTDSERDSHSRNGGNTDTPGRDIPDGSYKISRDVKGNDSDATDNMVNNRSSGGVTGIVEWALSAFGKLVGVIISIFDTGAIS